MRAAAAVLWALLQYECAAQRLATHWAQGLADATSASSLRGGDRRLQPPGPPPGMGGGGCSTENGCASSSECTGLSDGDRCALDGSDSFIDRELTYDTGTGKFSGTILTNSCNDHVKAYEGSDAPQAKASCEEQTIPSPSVDSPGAVPRLGRIGMTLSGGVNIYGPFEAGFNDCAVDGQPCVCSGADCEAGLDVGTCESHLKLECTSDLQASMLMDTCGGHADPYHIHTNPVCNYVASPSGHSTAVGVGLDGFVIYGIFESSGQRPCDLDACHGHVGPVPANSEYGIEAGDVYHYHTSDADVLPYTWTLGCYGDPATPMTTAQCKAISSECDDDDALSITTEEHPSGMTVDPFCPCFDRAVPEGCPGAPTASPTVEGEAPAPTADEGAEPGSSSAAQRAPSLWSAVAGLVVASYLCRLR